MPRFKMTLFLTALSLNAFAQSVIATYVPPLPSQPSSVSVLLPHSYGVGNCSFVTTPQSGTPSTIVTQIASSNCTTLLKLDGLYYPIVGDVNVYAGQFALAFPNSPVRTCTGAGFDSIRVLLDDRRAPAGAPMLFLSQFLIPMSADRVTFDVLATLPQATVVINIKTQSGAVHCTDPVQNPNDTIFKSGFQ